MTATAAVPRLSGNSIVKVAATSAAATSIEWYDFFIYGTAAALVFPKLFFAAGLPLAVAQMASFSTFAVGFIARPVGGVIFGHFGDIVGRKKALVTALLLMGASTTLIGLLPSYHAIGVAAPLLLILARFVQGLAIGGQWGGAALLAIESAPPGKRGFYGSFAQVGVPVGVVLANLIFLLMTSSLSPEAFQSWGWRVPFLLSVVLVGLGLYVQLVLEDSPEFRALEEAAAKQAAAGKAVKKRSPLIAVVLNHPKEILLAAGAFMASNGCFYLIITYVVAYATKELGVERSHVLWAVLLGSAISAPSLVVTAMISDRYGRRGIFMLGAVLSGLWAFPFFMLIDTGGFWQMLIAIAVGLSVLNFMYGPQAALFAELFTVEMRYSGASLGYQIGAILAGGFAPMIATALLANYHTSMAISAYMAVLCLISLISIFLIAETYKRA